MRIGFNHLLIGDRADGSRQRDFNTMPTLLRLLQDEGHEAHVYVARDIARRHLDSLVGPAPLAKVIRTPIPTAPTWRRVLQGALYFPGEVNRRRLDLLHTYAVPVLPAPCPTVLTVNDVRFIHQPDTYTPGRLQFLRTVYPISLHVAVRIIAISQDTKQDLHSGFGIPLDKIDVVPVPVDPTFVRERNPERLAAARTAYNLPDRYILAVGKLEPRKNLKRLVEAYCLLVRNHPETPDLVILGKQYFGYDEVLSAARASGLGERIHFTGFVAEEHLAAAYTLAELFVFPSLHEGFGIPILEAMACEAPVVTSNVTAMPEVAGDAAIPIDPYRVESIADGMATGLFDAQRRAQMIADGLARVTHFSPERTAELTLASYRRVFDQHRISTPFAARVSVPKTEHATQNEVSRQSIPVLHPITRLIIGGAQENTMLTASLLDKSAWDAEIVSGIQTGAEGSLIETVRARGVPLHLEPSLVREINPLKDAIALWRLYRLMRKQRYQVVHTHSSKAGVLGRWAAWLAQTPVIVHTVHGWGHHERQHPLVRAYYIWIERVTLPITDRLIVVSPLNREKGVRDGIGKPGDYVVIRSGIELERFGHPTAPRAQTRAALGIPEGAPVMGSVTRLSAQKAPLDFVHAAARVHAERPDVWFVMVGDGSLRDEVEQLASELGIRDRLVLTGLRRDVPELLATFDLFVLSSLWEGLPRVIIQAMASGLPVVATAADGTAEVIKQGVNGFLTPPGDPDTLAGMALQVLNNPQLAQAMGAAGLAGVEEFSDRRMVEQIDALYRELLTKA